MAVSDTVRDAIRWFRNQPPPHRMEDELDADPTRVWLREQEQAAKASAQRRRDWLENKLVYRKGSES